MYEVLMLSMPLCPFHHAMSPLRSHLSSFLALSIYYLSTFLSLLQSIVDNKVQGMEKLCMSCVQLALHRWQLLPRVHTGCGAHKPLLHLFHQVLDQRMLDWKIRQGSRAEFLKG